MTPRIKNIIIYGAIVIVLVSVYVFFIKGGPEEADLTSAVPEETTGLPASSQPNSQLAQDFLNLLLNVKTIKLNDAIFATPAFMSLRDSSIVLTPDGNEGRPNPFAPLGSDNVAVPAPTPVSASNPSSATGVPIPITTTPIPMATPTATIN